MKSSIEDILNTWGTNEIKYGLNKATASHTLTQDMRRVGLAFSYNFGKKFFQEKENMLMLPKMYKIE
ncbi:MAG: hypothetical protein ABI844_00120 [Saprospiraceae bacterium]